MITLQIKSTHSGIWELDHMPNGWVQAVHPDYDGAEDGCLTTLTGKTVYELMSLVREFDEEQLEHDPDLRA